MDAEIVTAAADQPDRPTPVDPDRGFPTMSALDFVRLRDSVGTQTEVAIELRTARKTMGRWERGERPVPGIAAAAIQLLADKAAERRARTEAAILDERLADAREG